MGTSRVLRLGSERTKRRFPRMERRARLERTVSEREQTIYVFLSRAKERQGYKKALRR